MRYILPVFCFFLTQYLSAQTYAIKNVTVIPMDKERVIAGQTVLIENGKIKQINKTSSVTIPPSAIVIDGNGKYILPGLFDMHAHFFYEQGENVNTNEAELKVMLANGLTTVRIECGDPAYLEARENVKAKKWIGPELIVASPQLVGQWPWQGKMFAAICKTPEEGEQAVKKFKQEGYDQVKITFMVKKDVYDAIVKTAAREGIKVTGHVGPDVKLPRALQARQQIEHMDEFTEMLLPDTTYNHGQSVSDMGVWRRNSWNTVEHLQESKIPGLVRQVKQAGIAVTPTNFFFISCFGRKQDEATIKEKPDYAFIPKDILAERWSIRERYWGNPPNTAESRDKYVRLRQKMTYELWKGGVPLMAGSDSPEWFLVQGFAIHDELATFAEAGIPPFAVLQTATTNTAAYLGLKNKGTVVQGKDADLILLNKNPLEDINNTRSIEAVFKNGTYYDRQQLNIMLEEAKAVLAK